jgi:hypothetical protein
LALTTHGTTPFDLRLEVQRGDTPQGYRLNGRQSYLDHPGAYVWDNETRDYRQPAPQMPICRAATHSSFATARSECLYSVGAARDDSLAPSLYSPDGAEWTLPGPSLSAVADRGAALPGLVASGTFSGSAHALSGTSTAAAVTSRMIATAFDAGQLPAPSGSNEAAYLISLYGSTTVADPSRQGIGILFAPVRYPVLPMVTG